MTTLHEQITIRPSTFLTPEERASRGIVAETVLSARVGRGTERHAVSVTVWEARPETFNEYTGKMMPASPRHWNGSRTYCGSQRFGSGAHSYSATAPVTCERCLGRGWTLVTENYPEDVLVEDRIRYYRPR